MSQITVMRTDKAMPAAMDQVAPKPESTMTRWRRENPEKAAATAAAYRDRQRAANARYEEANKERRKIERAENQKKNKAKRAIRRAERKDILRDRARVWRAENPEKSRLSVGSWQAKNPEVARLCVQRRRARIAGAGGGGLSRGITKKLLTAQKGRCAVCRGELSKSGYHLDHVVPLVVGGLHADKNMQLLCPSCNHSKSARDPVEFMQSRGFLL